MNFLKTDIEGCFVIECDRHFDDRGYFQELYQKGKYQIDIKEMLQSNWSSSKKNVLRGIHLAGYAKLVTCVTGRIWDLVVDLRRDSPTFKKHIGIELEANSNKQIFVPRNCGHGFVALEENTNVVYFQDGKYADGEKTIHYKDPELKINWPGENHIVSLRDEKAEFLNLDSIYFSHASYKETQTMIS
jgi:dTDP-4-dehydrorhamnose 3,5-epimerase